MPDLPISALPAATTPLGGTEKVALVQGGVTKQTDINEISGGSVTLQSAFNNGQTITMTAASPSGVVVSVDAGGPNIPILVTDKNLKQSLVLDGGTGRLATEYDLVALKNTFGPAIPWGSWGPSTMLHWNGDVIAFRVGAASANQFDQANIGPNTYGFGSDILCQGANQFAAGKSITINSVAANSFSLGVSNQMFDCTGSFILGTTNTMTGLNGSNVKIIGSNNVVDAETSSNITVVGSNISVTSLNHSNITAIGQNITLVNNSNTFVYHDGSAGTINGFGNNTFNVVVGSRANIQAPVIGTNTNELFFDKNVDVLGTYTPRLTYKVACDNACDVGSPLTAAGTAVPFVLRSVLAADPENTPIVAIALEATAGGTFIKVCGCSLVLLKKDPNIAISQGALLEKSNVVNGAVRIGDKAGVFAVAAQDAGIGITQLNAWLLRSAL